MVTLSRDRDRIRYGSQNGSIVNKHGHEWMSGVFCLCHHYDFRDRFETVDSFAWECSAAVASTSSVCQGLAHMLGASWDHNCDTKMYAGHDTEGNISAVV